MKKLFTILKYILGYLAVEGMFVLMIMKILIKMHVFEF